MSTPDPQPPQLPEEQPPSEVKAGFFQSPTTPYPTPNETDRSWAIGMHASGFAGLFPVPLMNLLAPFVLWLIKRPESNYLDEVGKEVVNFQISIAIYAVILAVVSFITCGFGVILFLPLVLGWLIVMILAVVKTSNGEHYRYPATIRLIK